MPEQPSGSQPGRHDSGENFVQKEIWRLEAERNNAHPDQHDTYDALIQQWERIVIDAPLSQRAQELLREQMSILGGWIFGTAIEVGERQYTADIPMLPVHVTETEMEIGGNRGGVLLFSEEGVGTEQGGIARSFAIPLDEEEPSKSVSRISFTPPRAE